METADTFKDHRTIECLFLILAKLKIKNDIISTWKDQSLSNTHLVELGNVYRMRSVIRN